jgi:hypothetical protein
MTNPSNFDQRKLEQMHADLTALLDYLTAPQVPKPVKDQAQARAQEIVHALPQTLDATPLTSSPVPQPVAPVYMSAELQPVANPLPEYRPSLGENAIVQQLLHFLPWEQQTTAYTVLSHVRLKTSHTIAAIIILGATGVWLGYIPIPEQIKKVISNSQPAITNCTPTQPQPQPQPQLIPVQPQLIPLPTPTQPAPNGANANGQTIQQ